nr:hypothetical protein [Actinomadura madurae]
MLVRSPATSANLGPGFDSLGLALALYDDVEVQVAGGGLTIEVDGEGAEVADRGERHLIVKVLRRTFGVLDDLAGTGPSRPGGLRLRCRNRIPHSRGLGSSSAAIVAGIVAARALHPAGKLLGDDAALRLATEIEGHPDNVAPCLAGRPDRRLDGPGRPEVGPPGIEGHAGRGVRPRAAAGDRAGPRAAARDRPARGRRRQRGTCRAARRRAHRRPGHRRPAGRDRGPAAPGLPRPGHARVRGAGHEAAGRRGSRGDFRGRAYCPGLHNSITS